MFYPRHILDLRNSKSLIFFMKPLNLLSFCSATPTGNSRRSFLKIASLSIAATAVAQSAEKRKSVAASANFPPIGDIHAHVCGIHFYSGDMNRNRVEFHPRSKSVY
jgi:hypothetical protein